MNGKAVFREAVRRRNDGEEGQSDVESLVVGGMGALDSSRSLGIVDVS